MWVHVVRTDNSFKILHDTYDDVEQMKAFFLDMRSFMLYGIYVHFELAPNTSRSTKVLSIQLVETIGSSCTCPGTNREMTKTSFNNTIYSLPLWGGNVVF